MDIHFLQALEIFGRNFIICDNGADSLRGAEERTGLHRKLAMLVRRYDHTSVDTLRNVLHATKEKETASS